MVIGSDPLESRAGALTLIGGELAFDFTNTSSGRGAPTHQEHLRSAQDIVDWGAHAKLLSHADADWLRAKLASDDELGGRLLARALDLREALYAIGVEIAAR